MSVFMTLAAASSIASKEEVYLEAMRRVGAKSDVALDSTKLTRANRSDERVVRHSLVGDSLARQPVAHQSGR